MPLSGCFASSPIHGESAFGTEPANEALRTADGKREGAITDKKKGTKYHEWKITNKIIVLLVGAVQP